SLDGRMLASGSADARVRIWDVFEGKTIHEIKEGHVGPVEALAFAPDGKSLAAGDYWTQTLIWDIRGVRVHEPTGTIDVPTAYRELGDDNPQKAYRALSRLVADPRRSVAQLGKALKPVAARDNRSVAQLITELDARERASAALTDLGDGVLARLR